MASRYMLAFLLKISFSFYVKNSSGLDNTSSPACLAFPAGSSIFPLLLISHIQPRTSCPSVRTRQKNPTFVLQLNQFLAEKKCLAGVFFFFFSPPISLVRVIILVLPRLNSALQVRTIPSN